MLGQSIMLTDWPRYFPDCEPIGHHLRITFPERWVRFHSLPNSKRYPETEFEYSELLTRHNSIMQTMTSEDSKVVLVTTGYSGSPEPSRSYPELNLCDSDAVPWRSVRMDLIDPKNWDQPNFWHFFTSQWSWRPGTFDSLIRLVSDNTVANVLIVDSRCRWIVHPYDGGMDVIVESPDLAIGLRRDRSTWLSSRADGL